jgi:protoporphyrinogen oxidase
MKTKINYQVVILGAGISGLTVSYFLNKLKIKNIVLEKKNFSGGLLKSFSIKKYIFDNFIHISHAKNKTAKNFFKKSSPYNTLNPRPNNLYKNNIWLDHSPQFHLYPLKFLIKIKIIFSYLIRNRKKSYRIKNYENWLKGAYGEYFAKNFPMEYTEKYWATKSKDLSTSWVKFRMQEINFWDLILGSFFKVFKDTYYSDDMKYPKKGGYESFLRILKKNSKVKYNVDIKKIDHINKKIYIKNKIIHYKKLVSTIPLPEFVLASLNVKKEIKSASKKLRCTAGVIVSLGLKKIIKTRTWFYIYDKKFKASRIYSPSKLSKKNSPKGTSSLQAEIFIDNKKKISKLFLNQMKDNTIHHLIKNKILSKKDIKIVDVRFNKYANVIIDKNYEYNRNLILNYFKKLNVEFLGRFGVWAYLWSDQCFLSGKIIAEKISKIKFKQ